MPNYNTTVRCSYCNNSGHNKATCQHLTERYKKLAIEYGDSGIHGEYRRQYERRSKLNLDTGEPISKKNIKPTRKNKRVTCSYCNYVNGNEHYSAVGHTRRTCAQLKKDKALMMSFNAQHRKNVHAALSHDGYGKGFLVGIERWSSANGTYIKSVGIATKIDWNTVNVFDNSSGTISVHSPVHGAITKHLPYLRHPKISGAWIQRFSTPDPSSFWRMKGFGTDSTHSLDCGNWWGVSENRNYSIGSKGSAAKNWGGQAAEKTYSASATAWDNIPAEYVNGDGASVKEYFKEMTAKRSKWS